MEFAQILTRNWIPVQTLMLTVLIVLASLTSSSPVRNHSPPDMTSEDTWLMTPEGASRSHLVMWMMTQKQLLPRVNALVNSATSLLRCTCAEEGKSGTEECLALASSLPSFTGLSDVPSQRVIQSETKKTFVKVLLENAYRSLKEVETLLRSEATPAGLGMCGGSHGARHFMDSLQTSTSQYEHLMTLFYKSKALPQAGAIKVHREEFSSERLLAIKLLYTAVNHLNQVSSALEYSVDFSWFSRMNGSFLNKGRRSGGKRRNRKNQKTQ